MQTSILSPKLIKKSQKAKAESDKLISNSKERLKDILPLNIDEKQEKKKKTMKKTINEETADLETQLKPILDTMAEKIVSLNNIDYWDDEDRDVWNSLQDEFFEAIQISLANANKPIETAITHAEEKEKELSDKEKLAYEEHIQELGNKIIELDGTNKTLTKDKESAEDRAATSENAANDAGNKLADEEKKVSDLTEKVNTLTEQKDGAETEKKTALDQRDEYFTVLKEIERYGFDFFPPWEEATRYSSIDENKRNNLTAIRDAAIDLKIVNEGVFDLNEKNQINKKLWFLEELDRTYKIFDVNGGLDDAKKVNFTNHLEIIKRIKERWKDIYVNIKERNIKLEEKLDDKSTEGKKMIGWQTIENEDKKDTPAESLPLENAFKTLLNNYEILYTKQNERADKADEYEEKIKKPFDYSHYKRWKGSFGSAREDWEGIWETEFIGFKTDAEIKRKHDIDELNENLELTTAKNERDAANKIITDAKNNLGVNDLKDDLTAKLGGKKLTDIIKERDDANTDKTTAEKARDTAIGERDTHKNNLDKWTTNFKTDADTAKKGYDKAVSDLATEKTDHDKTKDDLKNWTDKFGTDADAVQTELTTAERDRDYYAQILRDDVGYDPATPNWDNNLRGILGGRKVSDITSTLNDLLVHDGEINKLKTRLDIITTLTDNEVKNKLKDNLGIEDLTDATLDLKLDGKNLGDIPNNTNLKKLLELNEDADKLKARLGIVADLTDVNVKNRLDNKLGIEDLKDAALTANLGNATFKDTTKTLETLIIEAGERDTFKTQLDTYANYLKNDLQIVDLTMNLPNNDTGKSLTILIHHYKNTPSQDQIENLQNQLNQEKQGCQQRCQQKIDGKVKEIIQKINTELELKLADEPTLEVVINKIKELLRKPDNSVELANLQNQLNQANQTITELQEQLADSEKLKIIKQITIQTIGKTISQKVGQELSKKIANLNDLQAIKDIEKEMITKYLTNKEICQAKKDKLTKQIETERTVFIILLLASLLTIGGLIYKLKTSGKKKMK